MKNAKTRRFLKSSAQILDGLGINTNKFRNLWHSLEQSIFLTNENYYKTYAEHIIEEFNGHIPRKKPGTYRVLAVWEADGRMTWFKRANIFDDLDIIYMPRNVINPLWLRYLKSYTDRKAPIFNEYALDSYFSQGYIHYRKKFREASIKIMKHLHNKYGIDIILMPKLNDDWTLDFIRGLNQMQISVAIDDREGVCPPARLKIIPPKIRRYGSEVNFDFLNCYGPDHKSFFVNSGFDGNAMVTHGCPQTDYWFHPEFWKPISDTEPRFKKDRFKILYFASGPSQSLYLYPNETRDWTPMLQDLHESLFELLEEFPDKIQIIYKTGSKGPRDIFPSYNELEKAYPKFLTSDHILHLNTYTDSFDLTNDCDLILGFQTSGLIHAMFTDKPIISAAWGELYDDIKEDLLPYHKTAALVHAKSKLDLMLTIREIILSGKAHKVSSAVVNERNEFRERYFSNANGHVSERVVTEIRNTVQISRHNLQ